MLRLHIRGLLIFAICAAPPTTYAWATGENFDVEMPCKELSALNADKIIVRVTPTDGSFGLPFLVGLKDKQVLWSRPFPDAEEINVAKYEATCKGKKIILTFQFPARQPYVIQEYKWNGNNLVHLKRWVKQ